MIGAIVGDIVGSRFEWHNRAKAEGFLDSFLIETLNKVEKEFLAP